MIDKNKNRELDISPEEIKEPLVQSYRETLLEKKAQLSERKWNGVLYTTSLLLVLSVCVLGVSTVNNVEKMQDLESAMNQISGKGGQAGIQSSDVPAMSANVQDGDETDLNEAGSADAGHGNQNGDEKDSDKDSDQDSDQESDSKKETSSGSAKTTGDTDDNEKETGSGGNEKSSETNSDDSGKSKSSGNKHKQDTSSEDDGEKEPISSDSLETSALTEAQTSLLQGYYIVKEGDSLVGISKKIYGTAAKARKICTLNGIEDMDMIYAGQWLELP